MPSNIFNFLYAVIRFHLIFMSLINTKLVCYIFIFSIFQINFMLPEDNERQKFRALERKLDNT